MNTNLISKITMVTVLTTNWLTAVIEVPIGNSKTQPVHKEVGVPVKSVYADVVLGGITNRILVSQEIQHGMVRDKYVGGLTNVVIQSPQPWYYPGIVITNGWPPYTLEVR